MLFFAGCTSVGVNNKTTEPIPVTIVKGSMATDTATITSRFFRAVGAGENDYIVKQSGAPATSVEYLFVSAKPFSDAASHEIDLILKDENGQTLFTSSLPFVDETFSQPVQFFVKQNETLELQSSTDRFTFWASGTKH